MAGDINTTRRDRPIVVRIGLAALGGILLVVGVAGLVLPVLPGWALIIPGLAILAGEFAWARGVLDRLKAWLERVRPRN